MLNQPQASPAPASCPRWRPSSGEASNLTSNLPELPIPPSRASLDSRVDTRNSERATRRSRTGDLLITNGSEGLRRRDVRAGNGRDFSELTNSRLVSVFTKYHVKPRLRGAKSQTV